MPSRGSATSRWTSPRRKGAPSRSSWGARGGGTRISRRSCRVSRARKDATMGRLEEVFAKRREGRGKVLVAYLCMGDPSHEESVELALVAANAGADVLELG